MAITIGDLLVRLGLDASSLTSGLGDINKQLSSLSRDVQKQFDGIQKTAQSLQSVAGTITAGLTLPIIGLGGAAFKSAADLDALRRGLIAVTGSAEAADNQLKSLEEVAKLPGLGFKEAIQGSINLQAAGFSANIAERALKGFGNALATVGKGRADLDGVITALTQIASKGKISAEEIGQLAERVPQMRVVIREAFPELADLSAKAFEKAGISVDEFMTKVIQRLERLPQATGGARNELENWADEVQKSLAKAGQALLPIAKTFTDTLTPAIKRVTGAFTSLTPQTQDLIAKLALGAAAIGPTLYVFGKLVTTLIEIRTAFMALNLAILSSPVGLALLGLAGVGLAGFAIWKEWDKGTESLKRMGQEAKRLPSEITGVSNDLKELAGSFFATSAIANELTGGIKVLTDGLGSYTRKRKQSGEEEKAQTAEQKSLYKDASEALTTYFNNTIERQNAYARATAAAMDSVRSEMAKTQLEVHNWNAAMEKSLRNGLDSLKFWMSGERILADLKLAFSQVTAGTKEFTDALSTLGVTDLNYELERQQKALAVIAEATDNGARDWQVYRDSLIKVYELKDRLNILTEEEADSYRKLKREAEGSLKSQREMLKDMGRQVSLVTNDLARDLTDLMFKGGKLGDVLSDTFESLGKSLARVALEQQIRNIGKAIGDLINSQFPQFAKAFGGIFGSLGTMAPATPQIIKNVTGSVGDFGDMGGIAKGAGNAADSAGSAASGIVSSLTGVLGAVGSVGSMISGIVGNFQAARQEVTLNAIEHNTRYLQIITEDMFAYIRDINSWAKEILWNVGSIQALTRELNDSVTWSMKDNVAMLAAGGGGVTVNMAGAYIMSPRAIDDVVDIIVSRLRARGAVK